MKNKQYGPKGSRGDPPIESGSRGHPQWMYYPWGDRSGRWCEQMASSYLLAMTMNSALFFAVCFSGRTYRNRIKH